MEKIKSHFTQHGIHYAAVLIFYAIAAMFFSKSFDGYVVRQGDIEGYIGMSKEARDSRVLFDNSVGWTNAMFGGMPTTQINPDKAPFDAVSSIRRFINSLTGFGGITVFLLAMIGGYLLAIALGASPWIALLCGVGIGLSTFEVLYYSAGHNSKVHAIAYMPSVLAGVIWAYRKNLWIGAAIAALGTGLHIASGHPQMTYYLLFLLVGIGLTEVYRIGVLEKDWSKALRISGIYSQQESRVSCRGRPIYSKRRAMQNIRFEASRSCLQMLQTKARMLILIQDWIGLIFWSTAWRMGSGGPL